jgi:hypothetical protein
MWLEKLICLINSKPQAIALLDATHRSCLRLAVERSHPGRVQRPALREKNRL